MQYSKCNKILTALLCGVVCASLLTACGDDDETEYPETPSSQGSDTSTKKTVTPGYYINSDWLSGKYGGPVIEARDAASMGDYEKIERIFRDGMMDANVGFHIKDGSNGCYLLGFVSLNKRQGATIGSINIQVAGTSKSYTLYLSVVDWEEEAWTYKWESGTKFSYSFSKGCDFEYNGNAIIQNGTTFVRKNPY